MVNNVVAKKSLGQNFLIDGSVAQSMVEGLDIRRGDCIIEVGAGTGAVTQHLAPACIYHNVDLIAVEFDVDLIPILVSAISKISPENQEKIKVVNANILNFLDDFEAPKNAPLKFIGSLPYNITSPLLHRLIKNDPMPQTCVFLIQKEVAQKICSLPPGSNYLSIFVQSFYKPEILKTVEKNLFDPTPQVDGAILKLTNKQEGSYFPSLSRINDISRYEKFLHRAFSRPRKMLNKVFTKEELGRDNFEGTKRPQNYNSEDYLIAFLKACVSDTHTIP